MELCEKMLEYIKCATGPDLWNYVKKMLEFIKCATGPDLWNYMKKNAGIYKMCHRSGPVELCEYFEKKLLF